MLLVVDGFMKSMSCCILLDFLDFSCYFLLLLMSDGNCQWLSAVTDSSSLRL